MRLVGGMMLVMLGKCWLKKEGRVEGLVLRFVNCLFGRKRVYVKDLFWKLLVWL